MCDTCQDQEEGQPSHAGVTKDLRNAQAPGKLEQDEQDAEDPVDLVSASPDKPSKSPLSVRRMA